MMIAFSSFLRLFSGDKDIQEKAHNRHDNRSQECRPETVNAESTHDLGGKEYHEGIDDKGEKAQGKDIQRQGQEDKDRTEKCIQESDHQGREKKRPAVLDRNPLYHPGCDRQRNGADEPFHQYLCHMQIIGYSVINVNPIRPYGM